MSVDRSMKRRMRVALGVVGTAIVAAASMSACTQPTTTDEGASPAAVTDLPDGYARLGRGALAASRAGVDRGPLEPTRRIANLSMVMKLSAAQLADREALKAALVDPRSPSFRKFLTPAEYAARFGAPRASIARAKAWLASQGLEVHEDSPLGARVTFSGTVDDLNAAFRTDLRRYDVGGEVHYAMQAAPALPVDLAEMVADITNTHDFHPKPMLRTPRVPEFSSGGKTGFAPPDWANVYDVAKLYTTGVGGKPIDGTGVGVAIVGVAKIAQSDVDAWRKTFNLPASSVTMTLVPNTGSAAAGSNGSGFEAVLDVEWSGGIAPGAAINYVFVGGDDTNVDDATYYAIENNLAPVLSESWGGCEGYYTQAGLSAGDQNVIDVYGSAANVLGITYVAAAGDAGATTCLGGGGTIAGLYVSLPAAFPGVTSVGGTQFPKAALSGTPYFTAYSNLETVWNESSKASQPAAGGGGTSVLFSRPSYQSAIGTCSIVGSLPIPGITAASQRQVPDVAFTSAEGSGTVGLLVECTNSGGDCSSKGGNPTFSEAGGTSFATPAFAGVVALMSQAAGGRLGNINPLLYALEVSTPAAFHDIATGSNEISCVAGTDPGCAASGFYGYPATTGYDCATGLGSMDVYNVVNALAGQAATTTALALAPTATTEGTPVTFTATVAVPNPNASNLGGLVTFAFQSYDQNQMVDLSWTLGTGSITAGTTSKGTATFSGAVPPGLVKPGMQSVDVVAMYGGDTTHLPSTSAKVSLAFGPLQFAILPATPTAALNGTLTFTSTGGVAPVKWYTGTDTTCSMAAMPVCSTIDETTGAFTAGAVAGTTVVQALDADGAEALVTVNVVCVPLTACPAGDVCGQRADGCGGVLTCGTCTAPATCGGTGVSNQCGCAAATSCPAGDVCGSAPDGCGGMVTCGTCPAGETCSANQCTSTSTSTTTSSTTSSSSSSSGGGAGGAAPTSSSATTSSGTSGGTVVTKSGCSCKTAGEPLDASGTSLSAAGMLALAGAMRGRKRRGTPAKARSARA